MFKPTILLMATALALPSLALGDTLSLPADARVAMALVDDLTLDADTPRLDNVVMHPVKSALGSHRLPDYCVVTGNAQRDGERVRLTANALTCVETAGADSAIYSGELTAGAYDADGAFGLAACQDGHCRLTPDDTFLLTLTRPLSLAPQANPSAEINARRRQHDADEAPAEQ